MPLTFLTADFDDVFLDYVYRLLMLPCNRWRLQRILERIRQLWIWRVASRHIVEPVPRHLRRTIHTITLIVHEQHGGVQARIKIHILLFIIILILSQRRNKRLLA